MAGRLDMFGGVIRGERRLTFGGCGCISCMACEVGEVVSGRSCRPCLGRRLRYGVGCGGQKG